MWQCVVVYVYFSKNISQYAVNVFYYSMCCLQNGFDSYANYKLFLKRQIRRKHYCVHICVVFKLTGGPSAPGIPGKPGFPVGP